MINLIFILCVFFIPGILILNKKGDFLKNLLYITMFSLSFWIISAWFIKLFDFSLLYFFYIIVIISLIGFLFKLKIKIKKDWMILIFILILLLRLIPFFYLTAQPLSGDATSHALTAKLIVENDGLSDSYWPLLPIDNFGFYVPGFNTISALISLSGMEVYRSTLLFSCIIYFLIMLAFYVFLRDYFKKAVSLITALIGGFLTTFPQMIFHWGGNPTALSFLFAFSSFIILKDIDKKLSIKKLLLSSFFCVGSFLSHSNPFLILFYFILFYFIFLILNRKWIVIRNIVYLALFCLLLIIPFFLQINLFSYYSENQTEYNLGTEGLKHSIATKNLFLLIPIQAVGYTSLLLVLLSVIGWFVMKKDKNWIKYTAFLVFIIILMINSKYMFLPFSNIITNLDRMSLFLFIPFVFFSAGFINKINKKNISILIILFLIISIIYLINFGEINFEKSPYNISNRSKIGIKEGIDVVLFTSIGGTFMLYTFGFKDEVVLTQSDLKAMEWIKKNTNEEDLFLNNVYDAGKWIPAIAYRPILKPHTGIVFGNIVEEYYNMKDFKVDYDNLKNRNVKYVYIGKKYNFKQELKPEMFEDKNYLKVYDKDEVKICKVL